MSSHRTVLHMPVTYELPPAMTAEQFARLIADEAALRIEKLGLTEGEITVGVVGIDPVSAAYQTPDARDAQAPTATSNADAAGWGDAPPCNVCGDPGQPVDDGSGRPYALCDGDDQGHECVREGIDNIRRMAPRPGA